MSLLDARNSNRERASRIRPCTRGYDRTVVRFNNGLHDCQPKTTTRLGTNFLCVCPVEPVKKVLCLRFGKSDPSILDLQQNVRAIRVHPHVYAPPRRRVLEGIVQQIVYCLPEIHEITGKDQTRLGIQNQRCFPRVRAILEATNVFCT